MGTECWSVHGQLMNAGFGFLGACSSCPQRIKRYQMGRFVIKTYGSKCSMKMFESGILILNNVHHTKVKELIQRAVQESSTSG